MQSIEQSILGVALIAGLTAAATAQTLPKQVIGLTHSAVYLNQQSMDKRTCGSSFCGVANFQQRVPTFRNGDDFSRPSTWTGTAAGGTAYDGRHGGVWISNGHTLALYDRETCSYIVPPIDLHAANSPIQAPDNAAWRKVITGMACVESGAGRGGPAWLFVSWMSNHISKIEVSKNTAGKWTFVTKHCLFTHDVNNTQCKIAGLAADDEGRKLIVATSCFAPRPGFKTTVHVTNMDAVDWCQRTAFFRFPILDPKNAGPLAANNPICPNLGWTDQTLITGLAYDSCHDRLYVTDGQKTVYGQLPIDATGTRIGVIVKNSSGQNVSIYQIEGCCPLAVRSQEYTGLAIYPNKKNIGSSCVTAPCNSCSRMQAGTVGDAILGNPDFGLRVTNAPDNWTTLGLGLSAGSCSTTGINLGFCSTIKVPLAAPILLLFQNPNPTGTACAGGQVVKTGAIPNQPALCGLIVSTQWVVACRNAGGIGAGVTNCHEFEIQSN